MQLLTVLTKLEIGGNNLETITTMAPPQLIYLEPLEERKTG